MGGPVDPGVSEADDARPADDAEAARARLDSAKRIALWVAFVACLLGAAAVVFLPIGWFLNRFTVWLFYTGRAVGVPGFVRLEWYDFGLNAVLFAVPVLLAALLWPRVRWWLWPLGALVVSAIIEIVQLVWLPRDFSLFDIAANTLGALAGAGLARWLHRRSARN